MMKILKVTMFNLASLEGKQVIDFESSPLKDADLFSIVGETGSGKSTILDAICLALYGLAPRFYGADNFDYYNAGKPDNNKVLDPDDPRNILRKGTKECFSEVYFQATDGYRYRALWACSIARTNYSKPERRLFRIEGTDDGAVREKELDITGGSRMKRGHKNVNNEKLDEIIGLDYGQFTRTVMLAQNSFANFVKASDTDKAVLLEKLTGTQLYAAVARKIYDFYKEAESSYKELNEEVKSLGLHLLTEEQLTGYREQQAGIELQWKKVEAEKQDLQRQQQWYGDWNSLKKSLFQEEEVLVQARYKADILKPVRDELSLRDRVSDIQDTFLEFRKSDREIVGLQAELEQMRSNAVAQEKSFIEVQQHLESLKENWNAGRIELERLTPLIVEARKLKVELKAQAELLERLRGNRKSLVERQEQVKVELLTNKEQQNLLQQKLEDAVKVLQGLEAYSPMFEQFGIIKERLENLYKSEQRWFRENDILLSLKDKMEKDQIQITVTEQRMKEREKQIASIQASVKEKNLISEKMDVNELRQRLETLGNRYRLLDNLKKTYEDIRERQKSHQADCDDLKGVEEGMKKVSCEIEELTQERDRINMLLPGLEDAYRLVSGKSAEDMRAGLQPGKPCPVCGSVSHPYADNFDQVLSPLKNEIGKYRSRLADIDVRLNHRESGLLPCLSGLLGRQNGLKVDIQRIEKELEKLGEDWQERIKTFPDIVPDVVQNHSVDMIPLFKDKLDDITEEGKQVRRQFDDFQRLQLELKTLNETLGKEQADYKMQNDNYHRQLAVFKQTGGQLKQKEQDLVQLACSNQNLRETLRKDIAIAGWEQAYDTDYSSFVEGFENLFTTYSTNRTIQAETASSLNECKVKEEGLSVRLGNCREELQKVESELLSAETLYQVKSGEYVRILDGNDPDEMEQSMKKKVSILERRVDEENLRLRSVSESYNKMKGEIAARKNQWQQKVGLHENLKNRLDEYIDTYNQNMTLTVDDSGKSQERLTWEVLDHCFDPAVDWKEKRETLRKADEYVKLCQGRRDAQKQALEGHMQKKRDDFRPLEELDALVSEKQAVMEELDKQKQFVGGVLIAHTRSMEQMASRKDELERRKRLFQDWKELNDILGNASGDRFRETAQCFTLHFLIRQANVQLHMLNRRYSLEQVKDSLGIRVIDHDRADEVRNVSSLSGGETFLISLALALGLSSLSSHNVSMGNLFVDEGFGTLDSNSLNMVIDALSNLQSMQGKKVGVISHTAEMRERIRTQILVKKVGSGGKSLIEVVG